jgi:hypothetical protein
MALNDQDGNGGSTALITFKRSIIIGIKWSRGRRKCSLLVYRAGTNGAQWIDGAVKLLAGCPF